MTSQQRIAQLLRLHKEIREMAGKGRQKIFSQKMKEHSNHMRKLNSQEENEYYSLLQDELLH